MELFISKLISDLLVPPGLFFSLIIFGMLIRLRYRRSGQICFYSGIISLLVLSLPFVSYNLFILSQSESALNLHHAKNSGAKAIVVLGGGRYVNAPEFNHQDTVSTKTLERCRYGVYLQQELKLPILATGGSVYSKRISEAELMKQTIETAFKGQVDWTENESKTTYENAIFSYKILKEAGINDIILVTHALHMPRAQEAFTHAGFNVTAAPLGFAAGDTRPFYLRIFPSVNALRASSQVFHEWMGRIWYKLRYY